MDVSSGSDRVREAMAGFTARLADLAEWRHRMAYEIGQLPDTLQTLRQGAVNFERVGHRLSASTDALEQVTRVYEATLADSARRSADVATTLRAQVDALASAGSPDKVMSALKETQRLIGVMSEMNPFWPTPRRTPDD